MGLGIIEEQLAEFCKNPGFINSISMWTWTKSSVLCFGLQLLGLTSFTIANTQCKATPGSKSWPSDHAWARLNSTLCGQLIKTVPPGAVCHQEQPTFDAAACPAVTAGWVTSKWQSNNPVGTMSNNFNNDTCLPDPDASCSAAGYPVYVVNATSAKDVKHGVDFARKNNVRLIVKGTGHDYLGRSGGPNSLSIWTHHMRGLSFHEGFKPKGCKFTIDGPAITAAAGTQMLELDYEAHLKNLTIVGGGAGTVGVGGYLTGGGHSALSSTFGMAADQVLEMKIVTPGGKFLSVNECQNTDLFWAMRGGGGSTFGVITSVTIKAFPSMPFVAAIGYFATTPGSEEVWDVIGNVLSQYPALDVQGIMTYGEVARNFSSAELGIPIAVDGYLGSFLLPVLHPENTTESLTAAINKTFATAVATSSLNFFTKTSATYYPDFWAWYSVSNGPLNAGYDQYLGSRLLDGKALTNNLTALGQAYKNSIPASGGSTSAYLVGGKGVMNAKPRGGSNAVGSAWRKAYVHAVTGVQWPPFDNVEKAKQTDLLNNVYIEALRQLAPDTGGYVNEAYKYEPNFQKTFWGTNYPRLLEIKRKVDPNDVFWCQPCVGNERWKEIGDMLCKV